MKRQKSEITKKQIMEAYLALIEKKHWEKVTVKEIYAKTGITRSTFYQYFNSIYDLMEQIEDQILSELKDSYANCNTGSAKVITPKQFEEKFDVTPPEPLYNWFQFCMKNKRKIHLLLGERSDPYFAVKLKVMLQEQITIMMDADGMPNDKLREPFIRTFTELHLLAVKGWLSQADESFLSINEIINLLNTMRVGGNYLSYLNSKNN